MKYVPKTITRTVGRSVLRTKHHSPALLFGAGIVGLGATVILACRATLKVEEVLTEHAKDMHDINRIENSSNIRSSDDQDYDQMRRHITVTTSLKLVKLYAPTAVAGVVTVACLTTSHRQLTNRNAQLAAAYVTLQRFLEGYRGRVREAIGEDREKEVYYAATPVELAQDTPNGPKKIYGTAPGQRSPYSQMFDDNNPNFQESATFNEHFFRIQGELLTNKLRSQGHLFLNEVYDRLGLPRTATGSECGWLSGSKNSDDFVDIIAIPMHDFHGSYMLDFNAAGYIVNMAFGYGEEG
jgi:hypothetical protein